jgi:hypothetical protein
MVYVMHRIVEHVALLSVRAAAEQGTATDVEPLDQAAAQAAAEEAQEEQEQQKFADDVAAGQAMKTAPAVQDVTSLMRTADAPGSAIVHEQNP